MNRYLWLDLEATGLEMGRCSIIEVAAIATDASLEEGEVFYGTIYTPAAHWEAEAISMHAKNGLIDIIKDETLCTFRNYVDFENKFMTFLQGNFPGRIVLAGSSVHSDKAYLEMHSPALKYKFSHQVRDTTTIKTVLRDFFGPDLFKEWDSNQPVAHRAMEDARYPLRTLRFIREHLHFD